MGISVQNGFSKVKFKPISAIVFLICLPIFIYCAGWFCLNLYVSNGAKYLLRLEEDGRLSQEYGYVWQEINSSKEMNEVSGKIAGGSDTIHPHQLSKNKKIEFPSLSAIGELNRIKSLHKTIKITDRHGIPLAQLQTTHTCVYLSDINEILINSLITTEDKKFYSRKAAYDYNALIRSAANAFWRSISTLRLHTPRGSSTIHMQVARFLLMKYDCRGYAYTEQSISRKLQELKLAQALKLKYSNQEILTTYINHCVTAGKGMRGYHDISMKLFGVPPDSLNIAQSLYLARLVKWNRHIPSKIINQIKSSMPSLASHFNWDKKYQESIIHSLDSLSFKPAQNLIPRYSHIIDLANEYWKEVCKKNGMNDSGLSEIDISNPESIIRRYGNLTITLTLDFRLQSQLERLVNARGFGPDTTIRTDIRIASDGTNLPISMSIQPDTLRKVTVLSADTVIKDRSSGNTVLLHRNDTLIQNIRYKKNKDYVRRSCFTYKRDTTTVDGQYFAYTIMDSRTRQLLAYYSKDRLGSRLQSLRINRIPNGSSTSKPLVYALAYDWEIYAPTDMASDDQVYSDTCAWERVPFGPIDNPVGMSYLKTPEKSGYPVHNHHKRFDGYDYLYNHLSNSNNIIAVETMYRLDTDLSESSKQSEMVNSFLNRTGISAHYRGSRITGPSLYAEIAGICSGTAINDSIKRQYEDRYSTVLGTLELSLYEQMHMFNILYDGNLIVNPVDHPGLFIKKIELAGNEVSFKDSLSYCAIFGNIDNINPVHLALHKRLVSTPSERLQSYDICSSGENQFKSNFAKSGTTDDIIKPYYAESKDTSKTNYGLWNAVLRLNLTRNDMHKAITKDPILNSQKHIKQLCQRVPNQEIMDVTLACIGECDQRHTGFRDGKTLHGYVSRSLLQSFGIPCSSGFYSEYEDEVIKETSDKVKYANPQNQSDLSTWSKMMIKLKTGFGTNKSGKEVIFERTRTGTIKLKGKNYRTMLKFSPYMGKDSRRYVELIDNLKEPANIEQVIEILEELGGFQIKNQYLKSELQRACESLRESADGLYGR